VKAAQQQISQLEQAMVAHTSGHANMNTANTGPSVNARTALVLAYHSLGKQLDACMHSNLAVEWHERAFNSAQLYANTASRSMKMSARTEEQRDAGAAVEDEASKHAQKHVFGVVDDELRNRLRDCWELSSSVPGHNTHTSSAANTSTSTSVLQQDPQPANPRDLETSRPLVKQTAAGTPTGFITDRQVTAPPLGPALTVQPMAHTNTHPHTHPHTHLTPHQETRPHTDVAHHGNAHGHMPSHSHTQSLSHSHSHSHADGESMPSIQVQRTISDADLADEKLDHFDMHNDPLVIRKQSVKQPPIILLQQQPLQQGQLDPNMFVHTQQAMSSSRSLLSFESDSGKQLDTNIHANNHAGTHTNSSTSTNSPNSAIPMMSARSQSGKATTARGPSVFFSENDSSFVDQRRLERALSAKDIVLDVSTNKHADTNTSNSCKQSEHTPLQQQLPAHNSTSSYSLTHIPGQKVPVIVFGLDNSNKQSNKHHHNNVNAHTNNSQPVNMRSNSPSPFSLPTHTTTNSPHANAQANNNNNIASNSRRVSASSTITTSGKSNAFIDSGKSLNMFADSQRDTQRDTQRDAQQPSVADTPTHAVSGKVQVPRLFQRAVSANSIGNIDSPRNIVFVPTGSGLVANTNNNSSTHNSNSISMSDPNTRDRSASPMSARTPTSARSGKPEHLRIFTELTTNNNNPHSTTQMTPSSAARQQQQQQQQQQQTQLQQLLQSAHTTPTGAATSSRGRYSSWTSARLSQVIAEDKLANSFLFTGTRVRVRLCVC
jgi:hypothetical protein